MLGLLDDARLAVPSTFNRSGDIILLLGNELGEVGGSEYLFQRISKIVGEAPLIDLAAEKSLQALLVDSSKRSLISSAHDCSEGGLAVALAEALFGNRGQFGTTIDLDVNPQLRSDFSLFGETQSRVVVSTNPENLSSVLSLAKSRRVPATVIGSVNGTGLLKIGGEISISVREAEEAYRRAIPEAVGEV
jgi:phosphoribosylformylglycinamidine synthase